MPAHRFIYLRSKTAAILTNSSWSAAGEKRNILELFDKLKLPELARHLYGETAVLRQRWRMTTATAQQTSATLLIGLPQEPD